LAFALLTLVAIVNYRYVGTRGDGGTTHARFLFPAIAASSLLIVLGLSGLPRLARVVGFITLFGTCLATVGYSVYILPRSFGPTLPVYGDVASAGVQNMSKLAFASGMELIGWSRTEGRPVAPGQTLKLRLYWRTLNPPDFDYSAYVRLRGPDGAVIHDDDHGPGLGIDLLPHKWQPGEVIPDDWAISVPATAKPGEYQIEVGVYDYRNLLAVQLPDNRVTAVIGTQQVAPS
jgi:hypothetical protein